MSNNKIDLGRIGEEITKKAYLEKGFKLLAQNFQFYKQGAQGRQGELDLIMFRDNKVHIVEVKTRTSNRFGHPLEQITSKQLSLLQKTYAYFLQKNRNYQTCLAQLDVAVFDTKNLEILPNCHVFRVLG